MTAPGNLMQAEIAEAPAVFAASVTGAITPATARLLNSLALQDCRAIYTIARGSSDAAANILSYEFMRETGRPMTSLPPSVFSLGAGVDLTGAMALIISQSGASEDLVRAGTGARGRGASVVALVNQAQSKVAAAAHITLPIGAGPERAVPATKSVIGAIGAGMALLGHLRPAYAIRAARDAALIAALPPIAHPRAPALLAALLRAQHVYVIGRDTGFGAAHELALKLKETCALHAEAYSSSEVLHGPLQLVTKPLMVLILDTGQTDVQDSLNTAEARFRASGGDVHRIAPADLGVQGLTPAAAAALVLCMAYPLVLALARALGHDPDHPATLSKVTQTR
jgi:glutamine---fructose-6-phosphate transaminase (isomerizing)